MKHHTRGGSLRKRCSRSVLHREYTGTTNAQLGPLSAVGHSEQSDLGHTVRSVATSPKVLDRCMYCGSDDMTEEHIVADWVLRAFNGSRRTPKAWSSEINEDNEMRISLSEPIQTAKIVCGDCNSGWLSRIDNAAAEVLKPLIRGASEVTLDAPQQRIVASWMFKSALTFDAIQSSRLAHLRESFASSPLPPSCLIHVGPSQLVPLELPYPSIEVNLVMFGVRPSKRLLDINLKVVGADGTPGSSSLISIPIPGWTVMLGRLNAIINQRFEPETGIPPEGYAQIWPVMDAPVVLRSGWPGDDPK